MALGGPHMNPRSPEGMRGLRICFQRRTGIYPSPSPLSIRGCHAGEVNARQAAARRKQFLQFTSFHRGRPPPFVLSVAKRSRRTRSGLLPLTRETLAGLVWMEDGASEELNRARDQ